GVYFNLLPGLGVLEGDNSDIRQHLLALVLNVHGDEIMASAADRERVREVRRLKIGNEKDNCATRHDFVQIIERERGISSTAGRFEKQNLANESKRVGTPFLRRNKKFHPVGKKNQPHLVVVANRAESEQTGHLGGQFAF